MLPSDLPPIQVIVGPTDDEDGLPWYFSLNNRRLWVLKRCREEGLLGADNMIQVRVRQAKSASEQSRYSLSNCALEAKFMIEKPSLKNSADTPQQKQTDDVSYQEAKEIGSDNDSRKKPPSSKIAQNPTRDEILLLGGGTHGSHESESDEDSGDDSDGYRPTNPFSALS